MTTIKHRWERYNPGLADTRTIFVGLILLLGLMLAVNVVRSDIYKLVQIVPDDAFYYLETARHIAAGNGSSFDGVHATNGYHPLWLLILLPVAGVISNGEMLLRLTLSLGLILYVASSVLFYRILSKLFPLHRHLVLLGVILYALNPVILHSSVNGLETSLANFLFMLLLYVTMTVSLPLRSKQVFSAGFLLALLFLARTDTVFYIAVFTVFLSGAILQSWNSSLRSFLGLTTVMIVVSAPWLLWNYSNFGSIIQSSGSALPYVSKTAFLLSGQSQADLLRRSAQEFIEFTRHGLGHALGFPFFYLPAMLWTALAFRISHIQKEGKWARYDWLYWTLWLAGIMLVFVHAFVRWYERIWYFNQLVPVSIVLFCRGLSLFATHLKRYPTFRWLSHPLGRNGIVALGLLVPLIVFPIQFERIATNGMFPWQAEMLDAALWLDENANQVDVVAAFNAGIMGYFSSAQVTNADGVINHGAYLAIREHRLLAYLSEIGATHYADYHPAMYQLYKPFLGPELQYLDLTLVTVIDRPELDWAGSDVRIFRLGWRDASGGVTGEDGYTTQ